MNCLVTGATGFLGTNLVHHLVQKGHKVRAFGLPGSETKYIKKLPVEIMYGDITIPSDVDDAVKGTDIIYNVAGDTSWWKKNFKRQRQINVNGPVLVAEAALKNGVKRIIHTSTIDALGFNPEGITDETWDIYNYGGTGYNYADTKREGENRIRAYNDRGLEVIVIYPGSMMGPFDFTLQYGRLFFDLRDGKVPGCPAGGVSFGHVSEVAKAHITASEKGCPGDGFICAGENVTYRELFKIIAGKFKKKAPGITFPSWMLTGYGYLMQSLSAITKKPPEIDPGMARYMSIKAYYTSARAEETLGYQVLPLQKMVDDAFDWYRQENFL